MAVRRHWLIWLASLCLSGALLAKDPPANNVSVQTLSDPPPRGEPVLIGEIEDLDACMGYGTVADTDKRFRAVHAGPGTHFAQQDQLDPGQAVHLCSSSDDDAWLGVVYAPKNSDLDCGVSSPVPEPRAYAGPCRSGWVDRRGIESGE